MARKPEVELKEPGTLLACFVVPCRAVPWKAPTTTRTGHSFKDQKLVHWQNWVNVHASNWGNRKPYEGPVKVNIEVWLKRRSGSPPDITNLQKAIEDSLQNAVIKNDRQVREIRSVLLFDGNERIRVTVHAWGDPA